ncbi:symmetrical bis(5'-nucleosyl)-tetraphosphatase [Coxiella endosymbiont of Amblyomma sculptum]|uniref:symmetrical bis(5'-nucleosyl)-tetraphosphatase n=1 Tax=Coxiella endosymbiont of Amblyomma sculptum TaxID=2487929 RepID=UPI00132EDC2E|nr:symmetrical bis(5'-nucleosyl)-tetraphosphatase [Coxiella endosymbiont of Amblyomma sculptum]QHG92391.1 symmetrical bis(5'-nucleosyl)-tetraphosphatase [Coxiella endosymbiont of Amblyomma sculptum]
MSTYIIGDVHGCFRELKALLNVIRFDPSQDRLGFVGDLVNRGPNSLEVLRFVKSLDTPLVVLGNHDLFLLILGYGLLSENSYKHTLHDILETPDKIELLEWLQCFPLLHYEKKNRVLLVHAGLPPQWSIADSLQYSREVSSALQGIYFKDFLKSLFGNEPSQWSNSLVGQDRLRYITNVFTRMRFCDEKGGVVLKKIEITNTKNTRKYLQPWFNWNWKQSDRRQIDIFFGHWSALNGKCNTPNCYALDTGCSWGHQLTALELETKQRFVVSCRSSCSVSHFPCSNI